MIEPGPMPIQPAVNRKFQRGNVNTKPKEEGCACP